MKKVYCIGCKTYESGTCFNVKNCKTEKTKGDWYASERITIKEYGDPSVINKNNNCPYFEERYPHTT